MADYDPTASAAAASNRNPFPSFDGPNEPSASTSKPKKRACINSPSCPNKTAAANGLCKDCKPAPSKKNKTSTKGKKASKSALEDGEEGDNRSHTGSIFPTSEPNSDPADKFLPPSTPASRSGRPSIWDHPASSVETDAATAYPTPGSVIKNEDIQERDGEEYEGTPTPAGRSGTAQPVVEIPATNPRKRDFEDADLSPAEDEEGDHDEDSRKVRKISPVLEQQDTDHDADVDSNQSQLYQPSPTPEHPKPYDAADDALAIKDFHDAVAMSAEADESQLAALKAAQKKQYEAMEAASISKTDAVTTAKNAFIIHFKGVQQARDDLKVELMEWMDKHANLDIDLKTTEEQRDAWMSEKERVDHEKEDVETERDKYKASAEQLQVEKAELEKQRDELKAAKHQVEEVKAQLEADKAATEAKLQEEIGELTEKVEKARKAKADLIKSLTANDSD